MLTPTFACKIAISRAYLVHVLLPHWSSILDVRCVPRNIIFVINPKQDTIIFFMRTIRQYPDGIFTTKMYQKVIGGDQVTLMSFCHHIHLLIFFRDRDGDETVRWT